MEKRLIIFLFFLSHLIFNCSQLNKTHTPLSKEMESKNVNYYKDFDFVSLEGLEIAVEPLKLPFIGKTEKTGKIIVEIHGLRSYYLKRTFSKTDYGWHGVQKYESPNEEIHTYYLKSEKVHEISYQINSEGKKFVHRLSFFTNESVENYIFSRTENLFFKFNKEGNYPIEKARFKDVYKFEKKPSYIKVSSTREEVATNNILLNETSCYDSQKFSIFWWYHTGLLDEKETCY